MPSWLGLTIAGSWCPAHLKTICFQSSKITNCFISSKTFSSLFVIKITASIHAHARNAGAVWVHLFYIYVQTSGGGNCAEYHLLCASCAKNLLLPSSHSHPFNPTIADVLYLSTCLESWGSGAKRIMDECKGQNIKEPDWYQEGHNVVIKFARESMMSGEQPISNRHDADMIPTSNQQQKTVLSVLLTGEKHIQELMDVCGYKDGDSFRKSVLNVMIEKEWVAMTLPDKPKSKAQRYIITEKGKNTI